MTRRNLLVVSYNHPPFPGPGGNRWVAMSRYLRAAGHNVTILASDAFGGLPDDAELGIVRVSDVKSSRNVRRLFGRGELLNPGASEALAVERSPPAVLTKALVPDAYVVSWLPAAVVAARRHMARETIDCIITSGTT